MGAKTAQMGNQLEQIYPPTFSVCVCEGVNKMQVPILPVVGYHQILPSRFLGGLVQADFSQTPSFIFLSPFADFQHLSVLCT